MATTHRSDDRPAEHRAPTDIDTQERWQVPGTGLKVIVQVVVCVAIYAVTLFAAGVLAATIGSHLPGIPGVIALLIVGFGIVAMAPEAANWLCQVAVGRIGQ